MLKSPAAHTTNIEFCRWKIQKESKKQVQNQHPIIQGHVAFP